MKKTIFLNKFPAISCFVFVYSVLAKPLPIILGKKDKSMEKEQVLLIEIIRTQRLFNEKTNLYTILFIFCYEKDFFI
jgi:hypothetical protein